MDLSALAVPGGFTGSRLPFGVSLVAPPFREGFLCAVGHALHTQGLTVGATPGATPLVYLSVRPQVYNPFRRRRYGFPRSSTGALHPLMPFDTIIAIPPNLSIGALVETLTISPKYQVVIPKSIRGMLNLSPGQKLQAILFEDRIELIPLRTARTVRGFLKGIDTDVPREGDRI